jgi:hypothetical protein
MASTATIIPTTQPLAPADVLDYGTAATGTVTPYQLHSGDTESGGTASWDLFLEVRDLVINTTTLASAHIVEVIDADTLRLDADIFTTTGQDYRIVRGSNFRILPPEGTDFRIFEVQVRDPRAKSYQGVELFLVDFITGQWHQLYVTDDNGKLELVGRELGSNWLSYVLITNYTEYTVMVTVDGMNVTIGGLLEVGA